MTISDMIHKKGNMNKVFCHLFILIGAFVSTSAVIAQDSDSIRNREIYLTGNVLELKDFGMEFKSEYKKNTYLRLGITNIFLNVFKTNYEDPSPINSPYSISSEFRGRFEVGIEKRKQINNRLEGFISINFILGGGFSRMKYDFPDTPRNLQFLDNYSISSGFDFNSGFIAKISDQFLIAAEIVPGIIFSYYSYQKLQPADPEIEKVKGENFTGTFNLDNEFARLSLVYRWNISK